MARIKFNDPGLMKTEYDWLVEAGKLAIIVANSNQFVATKDEGMMACRYCFKVSPSGKPMNWRQHKRSCIWKKANQIVEGLEWVDDEDALSRELREALGIE